MSNSRLRSTILLLYICCALLSAATAQERTAQTPPPIVVGAQEEEELIRVNTELIQTSVSVFDKGGRFVDKLRQEDFELRVDGKLLALSFFERIEAGSDIIKSPATAAADRGNRDAPPQTGRRGRAVIFLVDDLHLSFDSLKRAKDLILRFIEQEIAPDDQIVIASPSGKIGFLQQFSDNKTMLRAAVERLRFTRDKSASDAQRPPMSEYEALLIDHYDREVTQVFANILLRDKLALNLDDAETQVRSRARSILQYAGISARNTYAAVEQALRSSAQLPMRKLVFFISDGFFLDTSNTDSSARLRRIADAATRANAVIYSFDIKGLDASLPDETTGSFRVKSGERWEAQDPLNVLAVSTGGRFVHNTNDLQTGVSKALKETSAYYLLVWRPDPEKKGSDKLRRIEVSVKGRPELSALVQSGYLDVETKPAVAEAKRDQKKPPSREMGAEDQLRAAFNSVVPKRGLPTTLVVNYLDMPEEGALSAVALQIDRGAVEFTAAGDEANANVGVVGAIFNAQGKQEAFFRQRLTLTAPVSRSQGVDDSDIFYNYQAKLRPGLYQVRVAARDEKSGRAGSASQWIEIPDLTSRRLTLSSLLLGERTSDGGVRQGAAPTNNFGEAGVGLAINRSFARTSHLRYLVYIYNAAREGNKGRPDVGILTQVLNGDRPIMTSPLVPVSTEGQDASRLPHAAEIPLASLTKGQYVLQVTVIDLATKKSVTQSVEFKLK